MNIDYSQRLKELPPYLFSEIDAEKKRLIQEGRDIIDLSVGDPDIPTPRFIVERLKEASEDPKNYRYPFGKGLLEFREAAARWYKVRFGVDLDPETEVLALIGSKEGISHIPVAFINQGDTVLIPNPAYPAYSAGVVMAGGHVYDMPLLEKNGFLPDFGSIPYKTAQKAKLMFLNYPNNPTTAVADGKFYSEAVSFAEKNNIIICHDAAYSEIAYGGYKPVSFLQTPGAKNVGIEFHSLSKTFNMTGWRVGFAVGNRDILKGLARIKSNVDSGVFRPIQCAATLAMEKGPVHLKEVMHIYEERCNLLISGLSHIGWQAVRPKATFYLWIPVPPGRTSKELSMWFLDKLQIIVTPGNGFGRYGEGYIRISLTEPTERIKEALNRILTSAK